MTAPLRVVLDTNVVLSVLLFTRGRMAWLRTEWQAGRLVPVVCRATVVELMRVLGYPKFKLTEFEQAELLADFLPYAETVAGDFDAVAVPDCRDPHDRIFLALARGAEVAALVSGDADLLALAGEFSPPIMAPDRFLAEWRSMGGTS